MNERGVKLKFAKGMEHLQRPAHWETMRIASQRAGILRFDTGDFGPDFSTPRPIIEAAKAALDEGLTKYVPGPGLPELRQAIAEEIQAQGWDISQENVVITPGAKYALTALLHVLVDEGDEVICPNPGYPPDEVWIRVRGGKVKYAPLNPPDFSWDIDALQELISPRTKLMIINTPQRPNGQLVENLGSLVELASEHGIFIISDEIFSKMVYPPHSHISICSFSEAQDLAAIVNTFSKPYVMTGFRIGWVAAPTHVSEKLTAFVENSITNVPAFVQKAAYFALTNPEMQEFNQDLVARRLKAKRDLMVSRLRRMDRVKILEPKGAFYCFPKFELRRSSKELRDLLLEKYGVAVVHGSSFGDRGEYHLRLNFAVPESWIEQGTERIEAAIEALS